MPSLQAVVLRSADGMLSESVSVSAAGRFPYLQAMISVYSTRVENGGGDDGGAGGDGLETTLCIEFDVAAMAGAFEHLDAAAARDLFATIVAYLREPHLRRLSKYVRAPCSDDARPSLARLERVLHVAQYVCSKTLAVDAVAAFFKLRYVLCLSERFSLYEEYIMRTRRCGERIDGLLGFPLHREDTGVELQDQCAVQCTYQCCSRDGRSIEGVLGRNEGEFRRGKRVRPASGQKDKMDAASQARSYVHGKTAARDVFSIPQASGVFAGFVASGGKEMQAENGGLQYGVPGHIGCPRCAAVLRGYPASVEEAGAGVGENADDAQDSYNMDVYQFESIVTRLLEDVSLAVLNQSVSSHGCSVVLAGGAITRALAILHESMTHDLAFRYGAAAAQRAALRFVGDSVPPDLHSRMDQLREARTSVFSHMFWETYAHGDLDLWLVGPWKHADAVSFLCALERRIGGAWMHAVTVYVSERAVNFVCRPLNPDHLPCKYQVNFKVHATVETLLLSFDLSAAACAFDGLRVYATPRCVRALATGVIYYSPFCENAVGARGRGGLSAMQCPAGGCDVDSLVADVGNGAARMRGVAAYDADAEAHAARLVKYMWRGWVVVVPSAVTGSFISSFVQQRLDYEMCHSRNSPAWRLAKALSVPKSRAGARRIRDRIAQRRGEYYPIPDSKIPFFERDTPLAEIPNFLPSDVEEDSWESPDDGGSESEGESDVGRHSCESEFSGDGEQDQDESDYDEGVEDSGCDCGAKTRRTSATPGQDSSSECDAEDGDSCCDFNVGESFPAFLGGNDDAGDGPATLSEIWKGVPKRFRKVFLLASIEVQRRRCLGLSAVETERLVEDEVGRVLCMAFGTASCALSGAKRGREHDASGCSHCGSVHCAMRQVGVVDLPARKFLFGPAGVYRVAVDGFFLQSILSAEDHVRHEIDTAHEYTISRFRGRGGRVVQDGPFRIAVLRGEYPYLTKTHPMLFQPVRAPPAARCSAACEDDACSTCGTCARDWYVGPGCDGCGGADSGAVFPFVFACSHRVLTAWSVRLESATPPTAATTMGIGNAPAAAVTPAAGTWVPGATGT